MMTPWHGSAFSIFSRLRGESIPTININGSNIQEVDKAKFLGIIIDNKLNWLEHIKCISRKIAKGAGIIIKARESFETETLLNLYNALIFPHISHCIHVRVIQRLFIFIDFMFFRRRLFV